ncbi:hypothetical protein [Nocardia sp. NPDC051463]|uniref:hypothetical protein n=1 Tax=Nocardia sp. NPDC051463 TaxID=3154845 RepID=UPI00343CB510
MNTISAQRRSAVLAGTMREMSKTRALTLLATAVVTAGGLELGAGMAAADARTAASGAGTGCVWAGTSHAPGATVVAGGRSFSCGTANGAPYWLRGSVANRPSAVPNPGAATNPTHLFSAGAHQPGTDYNDYCVGSQLIDGSADVYQVVSDRNGALYWKVVGPISHWAFDSGSDRHGPSWRSASLCDDGNLT